MLIVNYVLQICRKGTTFLGHTQVYIAEKCRFFSLLIQMRHNSVQIDIKIRKSFH